MNESTPILPYNYNLPSYELREEVVEVCVHCEGKRLHHFFGRNLFCGMADVAMTGMNIVVMAIMPDMTDMGRAFSWMGIAASVLQIATGIFCKTYHKCLRIEPDDYQCLNDGNLLMGTATLITNSVLLGIYSNII